MNKYTLQQIENTIHEHLKHRASNGETGKRAALGDEFYNMGDIVELRMDLREKGIGSMAVIVETKTDNKIMYDDYADPTYRQNDYALLFFYITVPTNRHSLEGFHNTVLYPPHSSMWYSHNEVSLVKSFSSLVFDFMNKHKPW
jgi:hypothetical protein